MTDIRARSWCFTLNNYSEEDYEYIKELKSKVKYMVVGREKGESGTPHLQGLIVLVNAKTMDAMKKFLKSKTVHLEIMKGTFEEASDYCKKQDKFFYEYGELPAPGKRNDLDVVREIINTTGKMSDVVQVATSYQSVRMAEMILKYHEPRRNWKPEVKWIYGATGLGKTRLAYEELGDELYTISGTGRWWDGYDAHENVLIDDLRPDFMSFAQLLVLLDRNGMRVENKGGSRQFRARKIYITTTKSPQDTYTSYKIKEDIGQLLRRIDEVVCLNPLMIEDVKEPTSPTPLGGWVP